MENREGEEGSPSWLEGYLWCQYTPASPHLSTSLWECPGSVNRSGRLRHRVLGVVPNDADTEHGVHFRHVQYSNVCELCLKERHVRNLVERMKRQIELEVRRPGDGRGQPGQSFQDKWVPTKSSHQSQKTKDTKWMEKTQARDRALHL